jgi:hypothetical protein
MFFPKFAALGLVLTASGFADPKPPVAVTADKGSLSHSGKFQPKNTGTETTPDPATRLKELGIRVDSQSLKIGTVEVDQESRSVSFPAKLQMSDGTIEYFLVNSKGKTHESLFVTEATPQDIHLGCLLAGLGPATPGESTRIRVEVTWETNGPPRKEPAEKLVGIAKDHPQGASGATLDPGPWDYTGSIMDAAGFAATREGSIIALITDATALVGNPRPGREDDTMHVPNKSSLPQPGHPVRIVLTKLPPQTQPKNP